MTNILVGEKSFSKIAAVFPDEPQAVDSQAQLVEGGLFKRWQVQVLRPADSGLSRRDLFERKVSPEERGFERTALRSHGFLGLLGGLLRLGLWFIAGFLLNWGLVNRNPYFSLFALVAFGITFGMLAGGLVTLRPDQIQLFGLIRDALKKGGHVVVGHPVDSAQTENATQFFQARNAEILRSL